MHKTLYDYLCDDMYNASPLPLPPTTWTFATCEDLRSLVNKCGS